MVDLCLIEFVANSEKMRAVARLCEKVAPTDATVLITGESGAGKNAVAEFIHAKSKRFQQNLITINCAELPRDLLEAELFGFERGAFTGAHEARIGRIETAQKSTLLLDEIAVLPVDAQAKLLRVLENHEFERLGGRQTIKINVRIIAATNVDLERAMHAKEFRQDLFFRLNVVHIEIPPLRERRADIADLSSQFLSFYGKLYGKSNLKLTPDALETLQNLEFAGNVRELSNLIERAVLTAESNRITAQDFPANLQNQKKWLSLAEIETKHIQETLRLTAGNKTKAARLLGISRKNLYEKLAKIEP